MKTRVLFICIFSVLIMIQSIEAQKVMLVKKAGKSKRFLYEKGDKIYVKLGDPEFFASGEITYIDDSLCTLNKNYTFNIDKVHEVMRPRGWFLHSWKKLYLVSGLYAGGSMINHSINGETPVFDNTIPWVSGSFILLGTASYFLRYKSYEMDDQWKLLVLDFDVFKANETPKE